MAETTTGKPDERPIVMDAPVRDPLTLRRIIRARWQTLSALLPNHMDEQRFGALLMTAMAKTPKLFECTGLSIVNAINQAAQLGLEINAATGEAYLIPYKTTATLVPGYKGLVKLAIRSREVVAVESRLVYAGEEKTFNVFYGTDSRIEHKPNFDVDRNPEAVIFAYAVAKLPNGTSTFDVMTRKQLDAIWGRSKAKDDGPWKTDREEMYRKTVTRRMLKYVPMSPELAQAIELSDAVEGASDIRNSRSDGAAQVNNALAAGGMNMLTEGAAQPIEVPAREAVHVQREETAEERTQRLRDDADLVRNHQ